MTVANQADNNSPAGPAPTDDTERELLALVRALAEQIGPRPSAGAEERMAAAFVIDRLRRAGYSVDLEPFVGLRSASWTYAPIYAALALAGLLGGRWPRASAVLGLGAAGAFLAENLGWPAVARLPGLPRGGSQNVVARLPLPDGAPPPTRRIVITAHLDSTRAALLFHPRISGRLRELFAAGMGVTAAVALGGLLRLVLPAGGAARRGLDRLTAAGGAYLLAPLAALLHREAAMPYVAGANDNASGVAVVLAAAERLAARLAARPDRTAEVWVVFTGCAEAGLGGMQHFLAAHAADLPRGETLFLNVDTVGAGTLTLVNQEGVLWPLLADDELLDLAKRAAGRRGVPFQVRGFHTIATDAQVPLARGHRALSLMALDDQGHLPNWHWPTDTWEQIDPATLRATLEVLLLLVRRLAAGPGQRIG